ncbi:MAG: hypothetical protein KTR26_06680 [Flammeovirgaceae bacterium]|nr:hypothetical protein [Flammeovirgaceae bacterium]
MKTFITLLIINIFFIQIGFGQSNAEKDQLFQEYGISVDFLNNALFGNTQSDFSYKVMEIKELKSSQDATPYFQTIEKQYLPQTGKWKVLSIDNPSRNDNIMENEIMISSKKTFLKEEHIDLIQEDAQQMIFQFHFDANDLPKDQKHLKAFEGKLILNKKSKTLDKIEVYATSGYNYAVVSRVNFFNATQVYKKDPKTGIPLLQKQRVKSETRTFGKSVIVDETVHYYDYKLEIQRENKVSIL